MCRQDLQTEESRKNCRPGLDVKRTNNQDRGVGRSGLKASQLTELFANTTVARQNYSKMEKAFGW